MHRAFSRALFAVTALGALLASAPAFADHTFDLAARMPPRLSIMFAMSWFGVRTDDPQGPGQDPGYGNWLQNFPACGLTNDPSQCEDFEDAGLQRWVASRRRPLAGIYSSSGRDAESLRRIDLMLSTLRRPCDRAGGFDAWAIQIDSVRFTSKYPANQQSPTWDLAYRALVSFYEEADKAGLQNAVVAGDDATVYWHFGSAYGLTTQTERLSALQADLADLATMSAAHPSSVKIGGKPLLAMYVDAGLVSPSELQGVLDGARAASGVDFYALGTTLQSPFFAAFDALTPWVNLGIWANTDPNASLHDRAVAYTQALHAQLVSDVGGYPGRVVLGALAPGFDDYTEDWGACQPREIPRDPAVLAGQADFLASLKQGGFDLRGTYLETWDDWTEGTEFEPDVTEGTSKLIALRQALGTVFGDPPDPAGQAALTARWSGFGQARSCCFAGGACVDAGMEALEVACPSLPPDGGVDGSAAPASDSGAPPPLPIQDASTVPDAPAPGAGASPAADGSLGAPGGCGCRTTPATLPSQATGAGLLLLGVLGRMRRRRR